MGCGTGIGILGAESIRSYAYAYFLSTTLEEDSNRSSALKAS